AKLPVMSAAMPHVAHLAIRNRGTIGGSIAHADPAAEHPMLAVFYDATIKVQGPKGRRDIPAEQLFCAALTTTIEPDEIVYEIEYPILSSHNGWGFEEVARRFSAILHSAALQCRSNGAADLSVMRVSPSWG